MADKTVVSKTLTIELDTGQTKTIETRGQGNRVTSRRTVPITVKVPKLSTVTTYSVDDQGVVTNPEVIVRKIVTEEEYDQLDTDLRDKQTLQIQGRGSGSSSGQGSSATTIYYAILAKKAGDSNDYITTDAVDVVFTNARDASLFKKAAAEHSQEREGSVFSNFDKASNDVIKRVQGLQDADARNQTDLSGSIPGPPQEVKPEATPKAIINRPNTGIKQARLDYGPNMRYPEDMDATQDCIQFSAIEYGPLGALNTDKKLITQLPKRDFGATIKSTVTLPIQGRISDSNTVDWGSGSLNPLQAAGYGLLSAEGGPIKAFEDALYALEANKQNKTVDALKAAKNLAFQEALQTQGLISRIEGAILNPNVELLFKGPLLRQFGFSFFLAARSNTETTIVKRIIRFFKQNMAVKNSTSNIFLGAPNVFDIKYLHASKEHQGIGKIKRCALKGFNVEYNPDGTYMTFEDGTMTAYRITMQFQELLPVTSDDYSDPADLEGFENFALLPTIEEEIGLYGIGY